MASGSGGLTNGSTHWSLPRRFHARHPQSSNSYRFINIKFDRALDLRSGGSPNGSTRHPGGTAAILGVDFQPQLDFSSESLQSGERRGSRPPSPSGVGDAPICPELETGIGPGAVTVIATTTTRHIVHKGPRSTRAPLSRLSRHVSIRHQRSSPALWTDNWVCSKFPAGEPAEALAAALREREFTNLGADPITAVPAARWDIGFRHPMRSKSDQRKGICSHRWWLVV
jgi:hypothetical protein